MAHSRTDCSRFKRFSPKTEKHSISLGITHLWVSNTEFSGNIGILHRKASIQKN